MIHTYTYIYMCLYIDIDIDIDIDIESQKLKHTIQSVCEMGSSFPCDNSVAISYFSCGYDKSHFGKRNGLLEGLYITRYYKSL